MKQGIAHGVAAPQGKPMVKTPPPGPESLRHLAGMGKVVARSNYNGLYGIALVEGDGHLVKDADGNWYIDCFGGAAANILGYNTGLEKVYASQAGKIQHTAFGYSINIPTVELAAKLVSITPGNFDKKVIFGSSGSDACAAAIKISRKHTGKFGIVSFKNAYHGSNGLSQPASDFERLQNGIYEPNPKHFIKHPFPVTTNEASSTLEKVEADLRSGRAGGIMIEPIQGDAGIIAPAPGFLSELASAAKRHGAVFIMDEVQSGMGRTGAMWAMDHEGVEPDIVTIAKGLSAGYAPVSATVGRREMMDCLGPAQDVFTYTGHAPSSAVALSVIEIVESRGLVQNARMMGERLRNGFSEIMGHHPGVISDVRGRGLMLGVEISRDNYENACAIFGARLLELGVYCGYCGVARNVLRIAPPLVIDGDAAETILDAVSETAGEMAAGSIPPRVLENALKYSVGL